MTTVFSQRIKGGALGPYIEAFSLDSNIDDFYCLGWEDCTEIHLSAKVPIEITGFLAVPGRVSLYRIVTNVGTEEIVLTSNDSSSLIENQLAGINVTLAANTSTILLYDYTERKWRAIAAPSSASISIKGSINCSFGDGITVIAPGTECRSVLPYPLNLTEWRILAAQSGSISFYIYADASNPPNSADSITASAPPVISGAQEGSSSTLTGWTTTLLESTRVVVGVTSCSGIKQCALVLKGTR